MCLKKNLTLERKFLPVEDRKVNSLLFTHSFVTKIGFDFGLSSYLKTKPESALRKHSNVLKSGKNHLLYISEASSCGHPPIRNIIHYYFEEHEGKQCTVKNREKKRKEKPAQR